MSKTLYLNESRGLTVKTDGPSLWIVEKGKAGVRVPARRVDRVIVSGNVSIDSGMLLLFAERSIPMTFLSRQGEPVAAAVGLTAPDEVIRHRQWSLGLSREGRTRGDSWIRARERDLQLGFLRRFARERERRFCRDGFKPDDYHGVVRKLLADRGEAGEKVDDFLGSLLFETILKVVADNRFDCHCGILARREDFGLVHDIVAILQPVIDDLKIRFFRELRWMRKRRALGRDTVFLYRKGGWKFSREGRRGLVELFEKRRRKAVSLTLFLLEDYARMLRENAHEDKISCLL